VNYPTYLFQAMTFLVSWMLLYLYFTATTAIFAWDAECHWTSLYSLC